MKRQVSFARALSAIFVLLSAVALADAQSGTPLASGPAKSAAVDGSPSSPSLESGLKPGEFTTDINALRLWYKIAGSGPVCILPTPGWGVSADLYFRTLKPFEKIFTMVYLETRGTGHSEEPKHPTEYTYSEFVSDLDGLRIHLHQDKIWVMGHSEGGVQALQYALAHPTNVAGLVLIDSTGALGTPNSNLDTEMRIQRRANEPWFPTAVKALYSGVPASEDGFSSTMRDVGPFYFYNVATMEKYKEDFAATKFSLAAMKGKYSSGRAVVDLIPRLHEISSPAIIIVGTADFICSPQQALDLHMGLTNSKLIVVENAGHFPWLEEPDQFFERVERSLAGFSVPIHEQEILRKADDKGEAAMTVGALTNRVRDLMGTAKLDKVEQLSRRSTIADLAPGIEVAKRYDYVVTADGRSLAHVTTPSQNWTSGFEGKKGWVKTTGGVEDWLDADATAQSDNLFRDPVFILTRMSRSVITNLGLFFLDEKKVSGLSVTDPISKREVTLFVDVDSGYLAGEQYSETGSLHRITDVYLTYLLCNGVRLPATIEEYRDGTKVNREVVDEASIDVHLKDSAFAKP